MVIVLGEVELRAPLAALFGFEVPALVDPAFVVPELAPGNCGNTRVLKLRPRRPKTMLMMR